MTPRWDPGQRAIHALRRVKHQGLVLRRYVRTGVRPVRERVVDAFFKTWGRLTPYRFDPRRYPGAFVTRYVAAPGPENRPVPPTIYTIWTGTNALSPNRLAGLATLRELNPDLEVVTVTPDNLHDFVVPDHPLHPSYEHLSLVHRSDYLRCYLLHVHGGGYGDIKRFAHSWQPAFERLQRSPAALAVGYTELSAYSMAFVDGRLGLDLRRHHRLLIGTNAYVMRSGSRFTAEWYAELTARMDGYADDLARHPGDERGHNKGYPVPWTGLLGDIFHPLCLKYADQLLHDDRLRPSFENYR